MNVLTVNIAEAGYEQDKPVIRDVSFYVGAGELVGLIGPNGAGKSTTVKALLGLLRNVKGDVAFGGGERRCAYVPEQPVLYEYMTLWEHMQLAASVHELDDRVFRERAGELLRLFRMEQDRDRLPTGFSKGMQQKMMLIIGFMPKPNLYVVDEPFVGLDPRATKDFLTLLNEERKRGAGVLMSTHVLDTAERISDRFVLINDGTVVAGGTLADVREQARCGADAPLFDCFYALT
ncbi:ABC transporter ATP-binding protein [Paenibacillus methanolicus]|uniref:ABC-2 type transport system ATP-binding protein n=1 Tax=Paenibacillus methanolicus TaxID=582686 RepID=A0A5S5BXX1_9BACL|nr:ABC transporter ATP-binding protein [Paenibacillus methanolicus]TYP71864.1 ABC-2 type transport system ATP-binding protein [Paenibacillus methanolicus]